MLTLILNKVFRPNVSLRLESVKGLGCFSIGKTMICDLQKKPVEFLQVVPEKEAYFQESYSAFNHNLSYYACAAFNWFFQLQENI